jgi:RND superfamily putative drug exporter
MPNSTPIHRQQRPALIVFGAAVLIALAAALISLTGMHRLSGADDTDPASESARLGALIEDATGAAPDPAVLALVGVGGDSDSRSARERAIQLAERLARVKGVARVDAPDPKLPAARDPRVSADGRSALVAITLESAAGDQQTGRIVDKLRDQLDTPVGTGVQLTGPAIVQDEVEQIIAEDLHRAELITIPILLLLAIWFFRSVVAAAVPVLIAGMATLTTSAMLVLATYVTDISVFALNLTTALAMGLGIDYGLLLVSRYREELAASGDVSIAIVRMRETAGRAVKYSCLTVAASMAALLVFPQQYLFSMGLGGVIVALVSGLVALLLVPPLLHVIGHRINMLSPRVLQRRAAASSQIAEQGSWYRLCMWVTRHAALVAIVTTAALLLLASPIRSLDLTTADATVLPATSDARQAARLVEETFPAAGVTTIPVVLRTSSDDDPPAALVARARDVVGDAGQVREAVPLDDATWLVSVMLPTRAMARSSLDVVEQLRAELPSAALVGGEGARFIDTRDSVIAHTRTAAVLVVLTTMFFVLVLTRSIVLPIKTVLMNSLTLLATFGFLVWVFQRGNLESVLGFTSQGALEAGQPAIVCALVFGLSTDYGVFLLSRVREHVDAGMNTTRALALGTERTGRVITAAALLFCVAMATTSMSRLVTVQQVSIGIAFAVLLDATVIRGLLVPALMHLLGRRNWWVPRRLGRAIDRIAPPHG